MTGVYKVRSTYFDCFEKDHEGVELTRQMPSNHARLMISRSGAVQYPNALLLSYCVKVERHDS